MKLRRAFLFLALFWTALPALAVDAPVTDPSQVKEHYLAVLGEPKYQAVAEPETSQQMRDWFSQWFTRMGAEFGQFKELQEMPRFASLTMTLFVIFSLAGLLYFLVRLTRRRGTWDRTEAVSGPAQAAFHAPEFYEEELRRAVAGGDWRGAWLASWRQFLSRLERGRLVEADRSRTNREYLRQLSAQPLPGSALPLLSRVVDAYDVFIYGRRTIAEPDWDSFHRQVEEATLLLHLQDHSGEKA